MGEGGNMFLKMMGGLLTTIYIISFFLPSHYGVRCSLHSSPMGYLFLGVFYLVWTIFVCRVILNDPMLAMREENFKSLAKKAKDLALTHHHEHYDHAKMVLAQRQMFMYT